MPYVQTIAMRMLPIDSQCHSTPTQPPHAQAVREGSIFLPLSMRDERDVHLLAERAVLVKRFVDVSGTSALSQFVSHASASYDWLSRFVSFGFVSYDISHLVMRHVRAM